MDNQTKKDGAPCVERRLTALFVDFDNIYISLLSKDKKAAARFATDPAGWASALVDGLLTPQTEGQLPCIIERRLVIARVYGNPVPRSKDRTGFAFVRNHFMQAGFEVIDCPPLTNQMKNGSDIRMVLDMRDLLEHEPRIDEFAILSGDSDFVPILLRLRAHDRRTMIYASVQTAKSYTSISDQVLGEQAMLDYLNGKTIAPTQKAGAAVAPVDPLEAARLEIIEEVAKIVEASDKPVPMEVLATTVRNAVGLKRTIDTKWAGHGQFSLLLAQALSEEFAVTGQPPYMVWHKRLHKSPENKASQMETARKSSVKAVIENILHITKIPPLSARYYQRLFQLITEEIVENGFIFAKTAQQTAERGKQLQLPVDPGHVQSILHRIRRHGHWFSDKDTARGLALSFRDSVINECMEDGLKLTGPQLDLIDGWFIPPKEDGEAPDAEAAAELDAEVKAEAKAQANGKAEPRTEEKAGAKA